MIGMGYSVDNDDDLLSASVVSTLQLVRASRCPEGGDMMILSTLQAAGTLRGRLVCGMACEGASIVVLPASSNATANLEAACPERS